MKIYFKLFIFFFILLVPNLIFSATIYFSPLEGEFEINKNFKLSAYVDSDQEINAVGVRIKFDNKYLRVIKISDSDSIINFWAVKPVFDNNNGEITFEGVVLNKAFKGKKGKIIDIEFRGLKETDVTKINFNNVQILAADGEGTDIFKNATEAKIKIYKRKLENDQTQLSISKKINLPKPIIISRTHPDQDKWYNIKDLEVEWELINNVKRVKLILTTSINQPPTIIYEPPINYRKIENLADGIYYFRLQFEDNESSSEISSYKVMIDTTPPSVEIKEILRKFAHELPKFEILAEDNLSGINYFEVYLDNTLATLTKEKIISLEDFNIKPGKHNLTVKAIDFASNIGYSSLNFEIGSRDILTEKRLENIKINLIYLLIIISILTILILVLILILIILYLRNKKIKKKIEDKISEIEKFSHHSFNQLRFDLEKQLKILESIKKKRELVKEEEEQIEHLKKHLNYIEKILEKNIKNIEDLFK
ncbi:MAG: hypothetical protein KatS3mg094_172 [Candidatus Parcubacteria bacterium]|nr:MAG: hypothetical protein KatS3mg094_172 [Candidatus Parcubacteria bacterium]